MRYQTLVGQLTWPSLLDLPRQSVQGLIWLIGRAIYRHGFKLRCQGREHLPRTTSCLLAANHVSHLDGPAIIAALGTSPNTVYSLAAEDYFFQHTLTSWLCRSLLNLVPFKRATGTFDWKCLAECRRIADQNKIILIFPEGTRSVSGELKPFKPGLGLLATQLQIPIVPVYVHGTYHILPKGHRFPSRHQVDVRFGKPLEIAPDADRTAAACHRRAYQKIADEVYDAVRQLRDHPLDQ